MNCRPTAGVLGLISNILILWALVSPRWQTSLPITTSGQPVRISFSSGTNWSDIRAGKFSMRGQEQWKIWKIRKLKTVSRRTEVYGNNVMVKEVPLVTSIQNVTNIHRELLNWPALDWLVCEHWYACLLFSASLDLFPGRLQRKL